MPPADLQDAENLPLPVEFALDAILHLAHHLHVIKTAARQLGVNIRGLGNQRIDCGRHGHSKAPGSGKSKGTSIRQKSANSSHHGFVCGTGGGRGRSFYPPLRHTTEPMLPELASRTATLS